MQTVRLKLSRAASIFRKQSTAGLGLGLSIFPRVLGTAEPPSLTFLGCVRYLLMLTAVLSTLIMGLTVPELAKISQLCLELSFRICSYQTQETRMGHARDGSEHRVL